MSHYSVSLVLLIEDKTQPLDNLLQILEVSKNLLDVELIILFSVPIAKKNVSLLKKVKTSFLNLTFLKVDKISYFELKKVINLATGTYISFLSLHNCYQDDFLSRMVQRIAQTKTDIVFCDFSLVNDNNVEYAASYTLENKFFQREKIFSSTDISHYVYNITPLTALNKIYRKSFLKEIDFEISENVIGIRAFLMEAFSQATRISCIDAWLFSHRQNSLFQRDDTQKFNDFKLLVQEFGDVFYFLTKHHQYALFEQSFLNYFLKKIQDSYKKLKEPYRSICQNYIQNVIFNYFDIKIKLSNPTYLYDTKLYSWLNLLSFPSNFHKDFEISYIKKNKNIIPVVMAINDAYTPYAAVTIISIKEHLSSKRICDLYIMHRNLSLESQQKLQVLESENVRINFVDINDRITGKNLDQNLNDNLKHISQETFYRFFIADELEGYDKAIYLDVDLVVQEDLARLFDIDIADNLLAGCYNPASCPDEYEYFERALRVDPFLYINAGVLLINTKQWRIESISQQCFQMLEIYKNTLRYQDQDILNVVCKYRIFILDYDWNFIYSLYTPKNKTYLDFLNLHNFDSDSSKIKILHYTWCFKPWNYPEKIFANVWWNYARKSSFYESLLFSNLPKNKIEGNDIDKFSQKNPPVLDATKIKKYVLSHEESCYPLLCSFLKEIFSYIFSIGKPKKLHRQKIMDLQNKLINDARQFIP